MTLIKIPNDDRFHKMWADGVPRNEMARFYNVRPPAISTAARRFGLPSRGKGGARNFGRSKKQPKKQVSVPKVRQEPPSVAGGDFWTPERDSAVIRTQGRYSEISTLAQRFGCQMQAIMARWHKLRAA